MHWGARQIYTPLRDCLKKRKEKKKNPKAALGFMARHGVSTAWQLAAAAALLATLAAITLVSRSRQAASELLMVVPGAPQLWLGEHW